MNNNAISAEEKNWFICPAIIICSLCLLIPAFYNHYPLLNNDDGTYIISGMLPTVPIDRPINYGLFMRVFSLNGYSLWLVIIGQAIIVSWLLLRILKNVSNGRPYIIKSLLIIIFLSIGSSLSWLVSEAIPDLFTSIAFLCIVLILMNKENSKTDILLFALFFFSVSVHLSHPILMTGTVMFLLIFRKVYAKKKENAPTSKMIILLFLSIFGVLTMTKPFNKSNNIYMMGSLIQKGVLKEYLDDNCVNKNYKICAYRKKLPIYSDVFLWNNNSPFYKMGGWGKRITEFDDIIYDILTTPKYLKLFIVATVQQFYDQVMSFNVGDGNENLTPDCSAYGTMHKYLPKEAARFDEDRQNTSILRDVLVVPNKVLTMIIICSLLALGYVLVIWRRLSKELKIVLFVCICGVVFNCLDCAAFGIVNGRYGCKMIWLIPFCVLAFMASPRPAPKKKDVSL